MKFSIRDLLLVTVIVALAMGWWADRRGWQAEVERIDQQRNDETQELIGRAAAANILLQSPAQGLGIRAKLYHYQISCRGASGQKTW